MLKKLPFNLRLFAYSLLIFTACSKDPSQPQSGGTSHTPKPAYCFSLDLSSASQMDLTQDSPYQYTIVTTGADPHVVTSKLNVANHPDSVILTFEYTSSQEIDDFQVFFAEPIAESRSASLGSIPASSTWKSYSADVSGHLKEYSWGKSGDYLRLDIGRRAGYTFKIRNIYFRALNAEEIKKKEEELAQIERDNKLEATLKEYLTASYAAAITNVSVNTGSSKIGISGNYGASSGFSLCEIPPYVDVTMEETFSYKTALTTSPFTIEQDRYVMRDGINYDRALSKWVIVKDGSPKDQIASGARYADEFTSVPIMSQVKPTSKKGLAGVGEGEIGLYPDDLRDLHISSATVNVILNVCMLATQSPNTIAHKYGGKTYYFQTNWVQSIDRQLLALQNRNIVVAAIILLTSKDKCQDKTIGELFQHPSYTSQGVYTMPDMTNAESLNCYAAGMDFLAQRYCQPGGAYGRIHNWIIHNEVDAGLEWTNMGEKPITLYTDTYIKSLRMCYNIVRQYDDGGEIFASFTHSWSKSVGPKFHPTRDMLDILKRFCALEGDFKWALAYHCYPEDLFEPKTWNDRRATFSMNSEVVSFKNLEVIDKWIRRSENMYKGMTKRSLWLSENGMNSRSYSDTDLADQAAGCAYGWKKVSALEGIDAIQWHRWIDNRAEGGLALGLRKFTDDVDPGGRKPAWFVYQAAGTSDEDSEFQKYLSVIGIPDWNIIQTVSDL